MRAEKSGGNRELMTKLSPPQRLLPLAKEEGIADCWKEIADCWKEIALVIQFTTSSRRLDGGAYCGAPVGGK